MSQVWNCGLPKPRRKGSATVIRIFTRLAGGSACKCASPPVGSSISTNRVTPQSEYWISGDWILSDHE